MINDVATYEALGYRSASPSALFGRQSVLESGEPLYMGGYREAEVGDIFGLGAILGDGGVDVSFEPTLWSGALYHIGVLFTLVLYLYMLLRSWSFVATVCSSMFSIRTERAMAMQGGELPLQRFKSAATLLGALLLALAGIRLANDNLELSATLYGNAVEWLPLYAIVVVAVIALWLIIFQRIVLWITRSEDVLHISSLARMAFIRGAVVAYPTLVAWLVAPESSSDVWSVLTIISLSIVAIAYLKDTFLLFLAKKISIFYWILYLCTAILLPLSFVVTMLLKYFG